MFKDFVKSTARAAHGPESSDSVESDKPQSAFILKMSIVLIVLLTVTWFAFEGLMWVTTTSIGNEALEGHDVVLRELRASEEVEVHKFDIASKEKGLFQIPIDMAIDRLVQQGSMDIK